MLQRSDNQIADLLLEEIGFSASGVGSLTNGAAAINAALERRHLNP
jgi:D-alanyl-D-alanine carboxypeptidase